jgi:pimeloyl-ACP methyl ester carboxylesterase
MRQTPHDVCSFPRRKFSARKRSRIYLGDASADHDRIRAHRSSSVQRTSQRKGGDIVTTNAHTGSAASSSGYTPVNGFEMYYEIHGAGNPLIVIPGGLMTIGMMGPLLPALAETRQVVAVEPQGHGHTADAARPLTYEQTADDIAALIRYLRLERADVFGFSVGGGAALQTAIRHPKAVRKLVVVSAPYKYDGVYPEVHRLEASFHPDAPMLSPLREAYIREAPQPENWPRLIAKVKQSLVERYDWTEQVAAIQAPTLIMVGDADTVRTDHAVEMFQLLGGGTAQSALGAPLVSQLAIVPGATEFILLARSELLHALITPFLNAPIREAH